MGSVAFYNGKIGAIDEISIPLSDRSVYFGDGVYDAAVCKNNQIYEKNEHLDRLYRNLEKLSITPYCTREFLTDILDSLVSDRIGISFIYIQMSRSLPTRTHSAVGATTNLLITINPITLTDPLSRVSLISTEDLRYFYCDIKTINLLPAVIASTLADSLACDEAVFHRNGTVTECAHSNIFILRSGVLKTHPTNNLILPGITRNHTIRSAKAIGLEVAEIPFTVDEMLTADEIFITSTSKFCKAVDSIDGQTVGGRCPNIANRLCSSVYNDFLRF